MRYLSRIFGSLAIGVACLAPSLTMAATEAEKQAAIDSALAWLATQQQGNGRWIYTYSPGVAEDTAATASVLLAYIEEEERTGWSVDYTTVVENGLAFLLNQAQAVDIALQPAGDPDSDGNDVGVKFVLGGNNNRDTYVTGLAVPAIAKYIVTFSKANALATGPLAARTDGSGPGGAWTYRDVVVNAIDYFAFGQNDAASGNNRGGWRYYANYGNSDNSTAQWPPISTLFALQAGVATPNFVKDELAYWVEYIQNANGGSGYDTPTNLVNEAKTGGLLVEMVLAEDDTGGTPYDLSNADLLAALGYLNTNWQTTLNNTWDGNFGNPYAMWSIYKGLELTVGKGDTTYVTNLRDQSTARGGGPAPLDPGDAWTWWEDYNEYLFGTQNGDGSWAGGSYWTGPLATAWAVNILQGIEIISECAILGDSEVFIGQGSELGAGGGNVKPNVCSNGALRLQSHVWVKDEGDLKAFARNSEPTQIGARSALSDSVHTNADLNLLAHVQIEGDAHAQGNMQLSTSATVVGDCQVAGSIDFGPKASCGEVTEQPVEVQEFVLPLCEVNAQGGDDIATVQDESYVLEPGDYGDVDFAARNDVTLTGGDYTFKSLRFGPDSRVEIQAPTEIQVENHLRFNRGVEVALNGPTPEEVKYFVNGGMSIDPQSKAGDHTVIYGTICGGSESVIKIGQNSYMEGGLYGKEIRLGAGVEFVASPASLPQP